ncbi:MAG: glutamate-5-semialdehyde dehydrogenase [Kiritimatiellia bacterium]|jgi:glutamate-5-semialdehyde dehydrogenase
MSIEDDVRLVGQKALQASRELAILTTKKKNTFLEGMVDELEAQKEQILAANALDVEAGTADGLSAALVDRLTLTDARYEAMIAGIQDVIDLKDPVGQKISTWIRPNGLEINKVRVPIGVIGIIYESRPNVTADAAVLCIKSSNAVILKGGREARHSNKAIAAALQEGGEKKNMPPNTIQLIKTTDRAAVTALVRLNEYVDLIIPRGGEGLIHAVTVQATVPVIKHYKGVCHVYIDESADQEMAVDIAENAKCQRPGVCNSMETLLVHRNIAAEFLPKVAERLIAAGVELRGDEGACKIVPSMKEATEEDWSEEYLDLILAVAVVDDVNAAIAHINRYGSRHSDAIVTKDEKAQKRFMQQVDSSTVYVNASTRFTDGNEFGLGAEMGISTDKLHARGPMGLEELTTYKYQVFGTGQVK